MWTLWVMTLATNVWPEYAESLQPNYWFAWMYFSSYTVIAGVVVLNMIVAIFIDKMRPSNDHGDDGWRENQLKDDILDAVHCLEKQLKEIKHRNSMHFSANPLPTFSTGPSKSNSGKKPFSSYLSRGDENSRPEFDDADRPGLCPSPRRLGSFRRLVERQEKQDLIEKLARHEEATQPFVDEAFLVEQR